MEKKINREYMTFFETTNVSLKKELFIAPDLNKYLRFVSVP